MDINELIQLLADPQVKDALKAIIKSVEANADAADEEAAAAMESDAGVTDADKKADDDKKPALMRAQLRVSRVLTRKTGELAATETALLAKAEAATTALIGKGKFVQNDGNPTKKDELEDAIAAEIKGGAKDRSTAILRVARNNPSIYNTARSAGRI